MEHRNAVEQLESAHGTIQQVQATLSVERVGRERSDAQREQVATALKEAEQKAATAEEKVQNTVQELKILQAQRVIEGEEAKNKLEVQANNIHTVQMQLDRQQYALLFVVLPVAIGLFCASLAYFLAVDLLPLPARSWQRWTFLVGVGLVPLVIACLLSSRYTSKRKNLSDWWLGRFIGYVGKKGILAPLLFTASAIYQGGAWDWFKSLLVPSS